MQPSLFETIPWTVTTLTRYLRALLEGDSTLQDVWVEGEISNLSRPASGHVYFTLKDAGAALRCVMWRSDVLRNRLSLQDGMAVEVHGRIGIYEPAGQYQLYADRIRPLGEGALFQEFLRLKALLEAEGLFDPARKRPIPALPRRIGIVTSASGAAIRDMLNTLRRRLPVVEVILAPSLVQGEEAPLALVEALSALARQKPDVILLARGGGSIEDLWAFNDERVVRAVAASPVPIICGVGHETDFTLCDFAADLRAPTPTAAAELATQTTLQDLLAYLQMLENRLLTAADEYLAGQQSALDGLNTRLRFHSPARRIQSERQRLDDLSRRAAWAMLQRSRLQNTRLDGLNRRLQALNPLAVLRRGYALVRRKEDGGLVTRVAQASAEMIVRVSDGEFEVRKI
jgi:exodeoxyribonuclease VII large subunit